MNAQIEIQCIVGYLLFIHSLQFDMLEMDRLERQLVNLPLLQDATSYIPDTVDLTEDALAREYWLYCFEEALDGVRPPGSVFLSFFLKLWLLICYDNLL